MAKVEVKATQLGFDGTRTRDVGGEPFLMEESALSANWMVRTDGKAIPSRKLGKGSLIAKALGIDEGLGQEEASRQATAKLVNDKPTAAPVTKLAGQDDAPAVKTEAKVQDGTPSDVL